MTEPGGEAGAAGDRVPVRAGYDAWAATYDERARSLVELDARHAIPTLAPRAGERILDLGCGTGRYLTALLAAESRVVGADLSAGMLAVAARRHPQAPLVQVDLQRGLPFAGASFDAVLVALVGEHLADLRAALMEVRRILVPGGRLVFSVCHPEIAQRERASDFEVGGVGRRIETSAHEVDDYEGAFHAVGFGRVHVADERGAEPGTSPERPPSRLLVVEARRDGGR